MDKVTLTAQEQSLAVVIGGHRRVRAMQRRRQLVTVAERDGYDRWGNDIEAVGAELAFAKFSGTYYSPGQTTDHERGDVAGYEVRGTIYPNGHLIVYPADHDDARIVLVVGSMPEYRIAGWITARDAKQIGELRETDRPGYWVDQSQLQRFDRVAA